MGRSMLESGSGERTAESGLDLGSGFVEDGEQLSACLLTGMAGVLANPAVLVMPVSRALFGALSAGKLAQLDCAPQKLQVRLLLPRKQASGGLAHV